MMDVQLRLLPLLEKINTVLAGTLLFAAAGAYAAEAESPTYVVSTFAGSALRHRDGPLNSARFDAPVGVACDRSGVLYVTDPESFTVRKIAPDGVVSTFAGIPGHAALVTTDGPGEYTRLIKPGAIACGAMGNVYFVDGRTIRRITPAGQVSTLAGSNNATGEGKNAVFSSQIRSIAVDSTDTVYVADFGVVRKILPTGAVTNLTPAIDSWMPRPDGEPPLSIYFVIAVGYDDAIYVAEDLCVRTLSPLGMTASIVRGGEAVGRVNGLTAAPSGDLFLTGTSGIVVKVTPAGHDSIFARDRWGPGVEETDWLGGACAISSDRSGNLYVVDRNAIRKITPGAQISTVTGELIRHLDGSAGEALFWGPSGIVRDPAGVLYVTDQYSHTVRKVSPEGEVSTLAGRPGSSGSADGVGSSARFFWPQGIALEPSGNLLVGDLGNHTIRRVTPAGEVTTVAGMARQRGSADGVGAMARFYGPTCIAVSADGCAYISDQYNRTIRKLTPDGAVTTVAGTAGQAGSIDGIGAAARFSAVRGLVVDPAGNVFLADNIFVRRMSPLGAVTTIAGCPSTERSMPADGPSMAARFWDLYGIARARDGTLFVSERSGIRRISPDGTVTGIAGDVLSLGEGYVDGLGSNARFFGATAIALDDGDGLFVADFGNHVIRKLVPRSATALKVDRVPRSRLPSDNDEVILAVANAHSSDVSTYEWRENGRFYQNGSSVTLNATGGYLRGALYTVAETDGRATASSLATIVGPLSSKKVCGSGTELQPANIRHPNGNTFDQVALTGAAESITADYALNQMTRTSFVDVDGDIVQVEFSGPGTLSLVLDGASDPAAAANYNQPGVQYVKGHAGIVIVGADERTNVSVFGVGRATAVNQALFKEGVKYDGIADIAFIAILSTNGKFGGVRTANANYFASQGYTGLYAPGVEFTGPVYIGDVSAFDSAKPVIVLGAASDVRITGGDLLQSNGQPVQVSGIARLQFTEGSDSHGNLLPAQTNQALLQQNGIDVTKQFVSGP